MSVHSKLIQVQNELKAPKNQYNSFGKYKYRSCEDILEALKPVCLKHNATVYINDDVVIVGTRVYVKATVTFVDIETGESIVSNALAREEESKKGMDGSQVTGASSSYARKYALNGMFCIDDTKDSDATNEHEKKSNTIITEPMVKSLYEVCNKAGKNPSDIIKVIKAEYNKLKIEDLNKEQYEAIYKRLESRSK